MTTELPPCPLPDCKGGDHHYHNRYHHDVENSDCKMSSAFYTICYGPHQPQQQWQPIEQDQIKVGMCIRATTVFDYHIATRTGVAHHTNFHGDWRTEDNILLTGWADQTTYEVDSSTIPADPDADLIEAVAETLYQTNWPSDMWDGLSVDAYRDLARAALAAIRSQDKDC